MFGMGAGPRKLLRCGCITISPPALYYLLILLNIESNILTACRNLEWIFYKDYVNRVIVTLSSPFPRSWKWRHIYVFLSTPVDLFTSHYEMWICNERNRKKIGKWAVAALNAGFFLAPWFVQGFVEGEHALEAAWMKMPSWDTGSSSLYRSICDRGVKLHWRWYSQFRRILKFWRVQETMQARNQLWFSVEHTERHVNYDKLTSIFNIYKGRLAMTTGPSIGNVVV